MREWLAKLIVEKTGREPDTTGDCYNCHYFYSDAGKCEDCDRYISELSRCPVDLAFSENTADQILTHIGDIKEQAAKAERERIANDLAQKDWFGEALSYNDRLKCIEYIRQGLALKDGEE